MDSHRCCMIYAFYDFFLYKNLFLAGIIDLNISLTKNFYLRVSNQIFFQPITLTQRFFCPHIVLPKEYRQTDKIDAISLTTLGPLYTCLSYCETKSIDVQRQFFCKQILFLNSTFYTFTYLFRRNSLPVSTTRYSLTEMLQISVPLLQGNTPKLRIKKHQLLQYTIEALIYKVSCPILITRGRFINALDGSYLYLSFSIHHQKTDYLNFWTFYIKLYIHEIREVTNLTISVPLIKKINEIKT